MRRTHRVTVQMHPGIPTDPRITYFPPEGGPVRENAINEFNISLQQPMVARGPVVNRGIYPRIPIAVTLIERNYKPTITEPQEINQGTVPVKTNAQLFAAIYTPSVVNLGGN